MAGKDELRIARDGLVINRTSTRQERALDRAVLAIRAELERNLPGVRFEHVREWKVADVVAALQRNHPGVDFQCFFASSSIRPDGGILSIVRDDGCHLPVLIAEKKNQGTNDLRALEGKGKQARGNAIERLGKNVIGFRAAMAHEAIFPFVCFGDGCDFAEDSTILDRVVTIAQFGALNTEHLHRQGAHGEFQRGTFHFRVAEWTEAEMTRLGMSIAWQSALHYLQRYGAQHFRQHQGQGAAQLRVQ